MPLYDPEPAHNVLLADWEPFQLSQRTLSGFKQSDIACAKTVLKLLQPRFVVRCTREWQQVRIFTYRFL